MIEGAARASKAMREIRDHIANAANESLKIAVIDEPGHGGACHRYDITGFDTKTNPARVGEGGYESSFARLPIVFQNGPIKEHGVNGVTNEALLAVLIDRMQSFQTGDFRCRENAIALTHLEEALLWLQKRTRDRLARGVEGTTAR
jgi:hypothetical protein